MEILIILGLLVSFIFLFLTYWNIYRSHKYSVISKEYNRQLVTLKKPIDDMNLLMEDMDYVILVKGSLNNRYQNIVNVNKKNSDDILKYIDTYHKNYTTFKSEVVGFYDIISLPYFTLEKAIKTNLIVSFNEVNELFNEEYISLPIFNQSLIDYPEYKNLFYHNSLYAIPFTNIYSVFGYNNEKVEKKLLSHTYLDSLKTEVISSDLRFGIFDNPNSLTHFYDFSNFLAIHNVSFFETSTDNLTDLIKCNSNDYRFKSALEDYLFFYRHGLKKNVCWSQIPNLLNSGEIDCCFLWTENIHLLKEDKISFSSLCENGNSFTQHDGWYFAIVKKKDYKRGVLTIINHLNSKKFEEQFYNAEVEIGIQNDFTNKPTYTYEYTTTKIKQKTDYKTFISKMSKNYKYKPTFYEMPDLMKKFCNIIHTSSISDLNNNTIIITKIDSEFKKILGDKYIH